MARQGSILHEQKVRETFKDLQNKGYKVIDPKGVSPDIIAYKDNKLIAVEVLGMTHRIGKGWHKNWTAEQKRYSYRMFDELIIITFKRKERF